MVVALVLPNVSGILTGPSTAVHGTILSQRRLAIQRHNVRVEELAGLDWTTISRRVGEVVHVLCVAGCSTETCVERTSGKDFGAHESVVTQSIIRCIDGCIAEVIGVRVTRRSSDILVYIAVRASNHNRELHPSSAGVVGVSSGDGTAPVYTSEIVQ